MIALRARQRRRRSSAQLQLYDSRRANCVCGGRLQRVCGTTRTLCRQSSRWTRGRWEVIIQTAGLDTDIETLANFAPSRFRGDRESSRRRSPN